MRILRLGVTCCNCRGSSENCYVA